MSVERRDEHENSLTDGGDHDLLGPVFATPLVPNKRWRCVLPVAGWDFVWPGPRSTLRGLSYGRGRPGTRGRTVSGLRIEDYRNKGYHWIELNE